VEERGGVDAIASSTTNDKEIVRNPFAAFGLGRDGPDLVVVPPRRYYGIDSSSRLDLRAVALPTSANVFMTQDTEKPFRQPEVVISTMTETVYSLVFDRQEALKAYPQTGKYDLVLGILASIQPKVEWEGCVVYEGESPLGEFKTVCIGIEGENADKVQERLVEGFEQKGVPVLQVYEGGPEVRELIARVKGETWSTAR
jgi:hypothetical protein